MSHFTSAKAILLDAAGNILVLRRSSTHPLYAYHLDLPGGLVDEGEDPSDAVAREVFEETGLIIDASTLRLGHEDIRPVTNCHYQTYIGRLPEKEPDVAISWEHDQHRWLTPREFVNDELPDGVDPHYRMAVEFLAAYDRV
ncbi:NUDIX hydrolase [Candidatus Saccharibacteria bacterium]|nr:NUDIX hydrolase [Candidatus Saccharibacteria bacterium]